MKHKDLEELALNTFNIFALFFSDEKKYREIYESGTEREVMPRLLKVAPESIDRRFEIFGLNCDEIAIYLAAQSEGTGLNVPMLSYVIDLLEKKGLIQREDFMFSALDPQMYKPSYVRYKITKLGFYTFNYNLAANLIFSFPYISSNYNSAVLPIEGMLDTGDQSLGTGFLIDLNSKVYFATCKHNVQELNNFKIFYGENKLDYSNTYLHPTEDIALVEVHNAGNLPYFYPSFLREKAPFDMQEESIVLTEVITMGYPSIPTAKDAYLMSHKGEINGIITSYLEGTEKIIFSAKTSSGNSGSPLINSFGEVIGIVEKELYDRDGFIKKGKPSYYSAVPIKRILEIQF